MTATSPAFAQPRPPRQRAAPSCSTGLPEAARAKPTCKTWETQQELWEKVYFGHAVHPSSCPQDSPALAQHPERSLMPRIIPALWARSALPPCFILILDPFAFSRTERAAEPQRAAPKGSPERQPRANTGAWPDPTPRLRAAAPRLNTGPSTRCSRGTRGAHAASRPLQAGRQLETPGTHGRPRRDPTFPWHSLAPRDRTHGEAAGSQPGSRGRFQTGTRSSVPPC